MLLANKSSVIVSVTIWIYFTIQSTEGLRILGIFPFQMRSQFVMGEELSKALAAKGHQVDVYSHFPLKKPIANYNDYSLKGSLPALTNNVTYEEVMKISDPVQVEDSWFDAIFGPMCDILGLPIFQKLIHNPPTDPPYDIAIIESAGHRCFIPFGRHLNIPVIALQALWLFPSQYEGFGNPINLAAEPSFITPYVAPMSFTERLVNFITHYRRVRLYDAHLRKQDYYIKKYFGSGIPHAAELQKDVALSFVNDDPTVYGVRTYVPKIVLTPMLHIVDRNETLSKDVKKWLDESTSGCILFTFGSMIRIETFPRHVLEALYKSFENIAPVRVLIKIAKPEVLPAGLPSNVFTQPWFQQAAVLKHKNTKAFVTHGGLMGTQESIYYEVPMIGIPIFFDHYFTINTYVKKQIAVKLELPDLTEMTFTRALREILNNPVYRENAKRVSTQLKDRPVSVMDNAIFWVEYIHRHGKDAFKSAAEDLTWWQNSLLDIYAFLITSSLMLVFVCVKLFKAIIMLFTKNVKEDKIKTK